MTTAEKPTMPVLVDTYLDWVKREGVRVHEGMALNLFKVETADWPRFDTKGAALHFTGRGDYCSMFLFDIAPGRSTAPVQHIFEALYFVLEGRGSTQLEFPDGSRKQFEWGPRSFFAIPLNAKYRHYNGSGQNRALLCVTTTAPLVMKIFHDDNFIFNLPYEFKSRVGKDEFYTGGGELHMLGAGKNTWQTNFVPDLGTIELTAYDERGPGSSNIKFAMADSVMHAHISEVAPATYKKAHRHGGGTHVLTLTGEGYSLLWNPGDEDFERVDWAYGTVFPPCAQQFHQHFVTSEHASRYLATTIGGVNYLFSEQQARTGGANGRKMASKTSIKEGGDQIEYEDQDPRIHEIWLAELKKNGITPRLERPKYVTSG